MKREEIDEVITELHPMFAKVIDSLSPDPFFDFYKVLLTLSFEGRLNDKETDDKTAKDMKALLRCLCIEYRARYEEECIDRTINANE